MITLSLVLVRVGVYRVKLIFLKCDKDANRHVRHAEKPATDAVTVVTIVTMPAG